MRSRTSMFYVMILFPGLVDEKINVRKTTPKYFKIIIYFVIHTQITIYYTMPHKLFINLHFASHLII